MSNPIRERVLDDRGFTNNPEDVNRVDTHDIKIKRLEDELLSVKKKLKQRDDHWESVRDVEKNKAVDAAQAAENENNKLKKDMDRVVKKMKDMELEMDKLRAENLSLKNSKGKDK